MANNTNWLTVSPMSGNSGYIHISLTALANDTLSAKTAVITGHNDIYGVSATTTVTLKAFEPTLTLSRSTLRFDRTGGTITFTVYSNTAWTISFPSLVYSYSTSAGTGDTEVTVVLSANTDEVSKVDTGIVKDCFNVNQLYLTVVQEAFISELTVTPDDDITFVNTGSTTSVTIESNCDWEISLPSWVSASTTTGESGTTVVTFTAGENGPTDRSGDIIIYYGNKEIVIGAYQPFYIAPYITVTPTAYTFPYSASSYSFIVDSYPEWSAEVIASSESDPFGGTYMEVYFTVTADTTVKLFAGNDRGSVTGVYINGVRQYGNASTSHTFSSGTHKVFYTMSTPGTVPLLSGITKISSVKLSDGVTTIPTSAFAGCSSLSSITIGKDVTSVGNYAFSGCSSLTDIKISATVAPSVSSNAFYLIAPNGTLDYPTGSDYSTWLSDGQYYLGYYFWNGSVGPTVYHFFNVTFTIPSAGNYYVIGSGVETIYAKDTEGNLKWPVNRNVLYFPVSGVQTLELYTTNSSVSPKASWLSLSTIKGIEITRSGGAVYTLPSGTNFSTLICNANITLSGNNQLSAISRIKELTLGGNCTRIPLTYGSNTSPFYMTGTTLQKVYITSSAYTTVQSESFRACTALTEITLGSAVTDIEYSAFRNCSSLKKITCLSQTCPTIEDSSVFNGLPSKGTLYYPAGSNYSALLNSLNNWTGVEI